MPRRKMTKISGLPKDLTTTIKLKKAPRTFFEKSGDEAETAIKRQNLEQALFATEEAIKKLPLLYKHYDLNIGDEGSADALVMRLAIDYVPGFQVAYPKKRGRKNVWNLFVLGALWIDVQKLVKTRKCSERSACNMLLKKSPWKEAIERGKALERGNAPSSKDDQKLKTILNRYTEAKQCDLIRIISCFPEDDRVGRLEQFLKALGDPFKITFDA